MLHTWCGVKIENVSLSILQHDYMSSEKKRGHWEEKKNFLYLGGHLFRAVHTFINHVISSG